MTGTERENFVISLSILNLFYIYIYMTIYLRNCLPLITMEFVSSRERGNSLVTYFHLK